MLNYLQPKNLETEAQGSMQDLETRKRIAELMSGIATQQLQAPTSGGVAGRLPGWAPLVQALAGGLAGMQQKSILEGQQKILQQQEAGDQEALSGLMRAGQAQPAKEIAGPALPGTTMPTIPASGGPFSPEYKSALLSMIAKGSPRLQPFAKAELEHVNKNTIGPVDLKDRATLSSIQANPNDPSQWKPKQDIHAAGDQFFNVDESGNVQHLGGQEYAEPFDIRGSLFQNKKYGGAVEPLNKAPTVNVSASATHQAENAFAKGLGEEGVKAVQAAKDSATRGQDLVMFADKLDNLGKAGVFSGPTANIQVFAANLADTMGIPGVDKARLANSETYATEILQQVAKMMTASGGVGRSFSDADREAYLQQFPQLIRSPQGRQQVINELRANGQMDLTHSNAVGMRLRQQYPEHTGLFDIILHAPAYRPATTPPAAAQKTPSSSRGHWEGQTWVPGSK